MTEAACQKLADYWDIGTVQLVETPKTGTINTIRILTTDQGRFVLRVYRHHILERIEAEHRIVTWVADKGIPAVVPLKTRDGENFVEYEGQFVTMLPFVLGKQISRDQLRVRDVEVMGRFLGEVHRVLAAYPVADIPSVGIRIEPEETLAGIDRLEGIVRAIKEPQLTDEYALARLVSRRKWLKGRGTEDVRAFSHLPFQVVHGDFQETNVFFEHGEISALIDWDKIYAAPDVWEIARVLHLMLHFEPSHCVAFLKSYRERNGFSLEALDVAVHCYGLYRAYDLWLYEEIYDQGNDRVRQFVNPGPFVPVADDWVQVRSELLAAL